MSINKPNLILRFLCKYQGWSAYFESTLTTQNDDCNVADRKTIQTVNHSSFLYTMAIASSHRPAFIILLNWLLTYVAMRFLLLFEYAWSFDADNGVIANVISRLESDVSKKERKA